MCTERVLLAMLYPLQVGLHGLNPKQILVFLSFIV